MLGILTTTLGGLAAISLPHSTVPSTLVLRTSPATEPETTLAIACIAVRRLVNRWWLARSRGLTLMTHRNYGGVDLLQADRIIERLPLSMSVQCITFLQTRLSTPDPIARHFPGLLSPGVHGQWVLSSLSQYILGRAYERLEQGMRLCRT